MVPIAIYKSERGRYRRDPGEGLKFFMQILTLQIDSDFGLMAY